MMKYSISSSAVLITIFLFIILLSSPALSSTSTIATTPTSDAAATTTSIEEVKGHIEETEEEGSAEIMSLMGWEVCKDNNGEDDEECLRRRVVSEAHLDYIYTQQHKH